MPIHKRRSHVVELLNISVVQRKKLNDSRSEILERPVNIWFQSKPEHDVIPQDPIPAKSPENVPFAKPAAFTRQSTIQILSPSSSNGLASIAHTSTKDTDNQYSWSKASMQQHIEKIRQFMITTSHSCQSVLQSHRYRRIKMLLWPVAFAVIIFEVQANELKSGNSSVAVFQAIGIIVNTAYLIDAMLRMLGLYLFISIEKAFNRDININEYIRQSGVIDIVVACVGFSYGSSTTGLWIGLLRLVLITTAVLEIFPYVDVLMSSMLNGMKTTLFTIVLLFTLIFCYGSIGYYLFRANDPFHYGSYFVSCLTFFQMTTFENWSTYYYINVYGCDAFPADYNYTPPPGIDINTPVETQFGNFYLPDCSHPQARPLATSLVFISYEILAGFGVISMCLAAVAIGINEKLNELRTISLYGDSNQYDDVYSMGAVLELNKFHQHQRKQPNIMKLNSILGVSNNVKEIKQLMLAVWEGQADDIAIKNHHFYHNMIPMNMHDLISMIESLQRSYHYVVMITLLSLLDSVLQMSEECMQAEDQVTHGLHLFCQVIFLLDILSTMIAYSYKMSEYLHNPWILCEVGLTILTTLPAVAPSYPAFQILKYMRVCRLFRILKSMSRYFDDLKIILGAISESCWSVIYVLCLMALFFSYYAIAGVLLLHRADPWYFGNLLRAMSTLLQIMTLDNWSPIMRNGIYGCYLFGYYTGYAQYDNACDNQDIHAGLGWLAALYFISFIILAAMILNSLFVGMIITSMELLKESVVDENYEWKKVDAVQSRYSISKPTLKLLLSLFEKLDTSCHASLSFDDMKPIMQIVNMPYADQYAFFVLVDTDHSGRLDFAEFSEMIVLMGLSHVNSKEKKDDDNNVHDMISRASHRRLSNSSVLSYESIHDMRQMHRPSSPLSLPIIISLQTMKETFQQSYDQHQTQAHDHHHQITPRSLLKTGQSRIHPMYIDSSLLDLGEKSAAASIPCMPSSARMRRGSKLKLVRRSPRIGHDDISTYDNDEVGTYIDDIEGQSQGAGYGMGEYYSARDLLSHRSDSTITPTHHNNSHNTSKQSTYFRTISNMKLSDAIEVINNSISSMSLGFSPVKERSLSLSLGDKMSPNKPHHPHPLYQPHPRPRHNISLNLGNHKNGDAHGDVIVNNESHTNFQPLATSRFMSDMSPYYLSIKSNFAVDHNDIPSFRQPAGKNKIPTPTSTKLIITTKSMDNETES